MATNKLAISRIKKLATGLHGDGGGLWLRVAPTGGRYWLIRYQLNGKAYSMGVGNAELVSIEEAREAAVEARKLIKRGVNPLDQKRVSLAPHKLGKRPMTFGDMADQFYEAQKARYTSEKYAAAVKADLENGLASLRPLPPGSIETAQVLGVLKPIWETTPSAGRRLREKIEAVLDFSAVHGLRPSENPARWNGHLEHLLSPQRRNAGHHSAMPYSDAPAFFKRLMTEDTVGAYALQFLILTAARSAETFGATWEEIGDDNWTVPEHRMKGRVEHVVPLTETVKAILARVYLLRRADGFVFPGQKRGKSLSEKAMAHVMKRMGAEHYTTHGWRSCFRDWAGDNTDFPREVAEAALAHRVGNAVEAAYRRGSALQKRAELMAAWEKYLIA